jgi:hypothetical protein
VIAFQYKRRDIRFNLPLPRKEAYRLTPTKQIRSVENWHKAWDQATRERWRALLLIIKAKLEAVSAGIVTFESEFFSQTVATPDGRTVYEWYAPQIEQNVIAGRMPPLLPGYVPGREE